MKWFFIAAIFIVLAGCKSAPEVAQVPPTPRPTTGPAPTAPPIIIHSKVSSLPPVGEMVEGPAQPTTRRVVVRRAAPVAVTRRSVTTGSIPTSPVASAPLRSPMQQAVPTPLPQIGNSSIENQSGRWLQVDVYDKDGGAIDTLNCRDGSTQSIPDQARELKIRVNGRTIGINRSNMKIVIDGEENLVDRG